MMSLCIAEFNPIRHYYSRALHVDCYTITIVESPILFMIYRNLSVVENGFWESLANIMGILTIHFI